MNLQNYPTRTITTEEKLFLKSYNHLSWATWKPRLVKAASGTAPAVHSLKRRQELRAVGSHTSWVQYERAGLPSVPEEFPLIDDPQ